MTTYGSEERALEAMRKELATERVPDLPWDDMERELLAKLEEAPMTSHPRSLDARVDDVPVASVRSPRPQFARLSFVVLAAAASFGLFWMAVSRNRGPIVISTASPSVTAPAASISSAPSVSQEIPSPAPMPVEHKESEPAPTPPRALTTNDVRAALSVCVPSNKPNSPTGARPAKNRTLNIQLAADGRISKIRFEPVLGASVNQCVLDSLRSGRFVGKTGSITIQF